ncbi:hypothetical protein Tco_1330414, partial [Tanacetum coccineum]
VASDDLRDALSVIYLTYAHSSTGRFLLPDPVESSKTLEKRKNIEYLNMGEARIKVECYDGNKRKKEGAMIDVDFIDNSGDNHPLDESCGLLGGIHHSSSINTKANSHVCGRLVTKNVSNIFNHKRGTEASIKTTKRVNLGRFVQVKYEPKIMQERNFKFVPKFILKGGGHPYVVKEAHKELSN